MATLSTLSTPIATPIVGKDGKIDPVWNEFFVRFMVTAGIKVSIDDLEADTTSLQAQIDSIDVEAAASITMSDSDGNSTATLAVLYDGNRTSDGVGYTLSGTDKYIEYQFGMRSYVDRISIWTGDANARVYVAYSDDGSTWSYLSAEADHTLDSEGRLVTATSQSNAALDYWPMAAGQNNALFPNNISALYVRLYMTGTYSTTIYELIPSRMLIAELASIGELSAITADVGLLQAGKIESANGNTYFDLDNNTLVIGNASGYGNITDKPSLTASGDLWGASGWGQSGLSSFTAAYVNNGNIALRGFHTDTAGIGSYLKLDTVTAKNFTSISVYLTGAVDATWDIEYSDNDADWIVAAADFGGHPTEGTGWHSRAWATVGSHRYWRLYKTDVAGGGNYHAEVQFFEGVGADVTQIALDAGALIDNAIANGVTLISGGYIRTSLLHTDVLIIGGNAGDLATQDRSALDYTDGADVTQTALDAGAAIDSAIANGVTLMVGGYIRTSLLHTDVLIVGGNAGDLAVQDRVDLDYTDGADVTQAALTAGAAIDNALANGVTLISGGYIRTTLLHTNVLVVGDNAGLLAVEDEVDESLINVTDLAGINSDMGAIVAGTITLNSSGFIRGGQTAYATGTGFFLGYSTAAYKLSIGDATNYLRWNGGVLSIGGDIVATGNIQDKAVTQTVLSSTDAETASFTGTWTQIQSRSITLEEGGFLSITAGSLFNRVTTTAKGEMQLRRGATVVAQSSWEQNFTDDTGATTAYSEELASGSVTYYLYAKATFAVKAAYRWIRITEIKK